MDVFDTVFLSFELPDGTSVEKLRATVRKDIALQDDTSFGVEFNNEDPKFGPVFDVQQKEKTYSSVQMERAEKRSHKKGYDQALFGTDEKTEVTIHQRFPEKRL